MGCHIGAVFKNLKYPAGSNRGLCLGRQTKPLNPAMRAYGNGAAATKGATAGAGPGAAPHKHTHTTRHTRADNTHAGLLHSGPLIASLVFTAFIRRDGCVDLQVAVDVHVDAMSMSMSMDRARAATCTKAQTAKQDTAQD